MPYSSINEIPEYVKKYDEKVKSQWSHVFNTVYKSTNSEERALKAANSVLKKRLNKEIHRNDYINHLVDLWLGNLNG